MSTQESNRNGPVKAILVTNISLSATEANIKEFFSFCGEVETFEMIKDGVSQQAIIQFHSEKAAQTALLLSNAQIMGSEIIVAPYTSEELPPYTEEDVFQDAHEELPRSLSQEEKPKLSVMVEILSAGYILNDKIIDAAKNFDETKGVSDSFKKYLILAHNKGIEINEKYKVTDTADELTQKAKATAQEIDEKYKVKEKVKEVKEDVQKKAQEIDEKYHVMEKIDTAKTTAIKYGQQALQSETGQKVQGFLFDSWNKAKLTLEEAKRVAEEKEGKKLTKPETPQLDQNQNQDQNSEGEELKEVQMEDIPNQQENIENDK